MAFDLNIAVKRSPVDQPRDDAGGHGTPSLVTIVDVTGELSSESAADLTRRLDDVVATAATSVIIHFTDDVRIAAHDRGPIQTVAAWIASRRHDGCNLYVDISDAALRDVFTGVDEMESFMLPSGADNSVPRRLVGDPPKAKENEAAPDATSLTWLPELDSNQRPAD